MEAISWTSTAQRSSEAAPRPTSLINSKANWYAYDLPFGEGHAIRLSLSRMESPAQRLDDKRKSVLGIWKSVFDLLRPGYVSERI